MGGRLIKRWLALPLKNKIEIEERHNVVEYFIANIDAAESIKENTYKIGDLERLISKVAVGRINPREVVQLKQALIATEPIKDECMSSNQKALIKIGKQIDPCAEVIEKIDNEIQNDAPVLVNKGNVISDGVSKELDELRKIAYSGKDYLVKIKERESEKTEISSLKIGFNNVFGYYIEVRNAHKNKVPEDWIRKQTLVNAERYITQELKEYEQKILGAEEKILDIETRLYEDLVLSLGSYIEKIQKNAHGIGKLDCLLTFAQNARQNKYVKPDLNDGKSINIINGRHPVIEQLLPADEEYVPNNILLDDKTQQIMIITGPNMSGKSALLRQTALITILAQIGSYVPAEGAQIGLVDKIFTRVGASDNLSMGESTFMVEMNETASILNNLSDNSLVLLDEIGRGTSTYDGVSIAWPIAEFIHENKKAKAKTLFATHYHEMNDLADSFKRIKNWSVSIKETNKKIIFLRKLIPKGSEHSFGIHVAKMAGMPKVVIERANEIMELLEEKNKYKKTKSKLQNMTDGSTNYQLSMFEPGNPKLAEIEDSLNKLNINELTPIDALIELSKLKEKLKN